MEKQENPKKPRIETVLDSAGSDQKNGEKNGKNLAFPGYTRVYQGITRPTIHPACQAQTICNTYLWRSASSTRAKSSTARAV